MSRIFSQEPPLVYARAIGLLYLILIVVGPFSLLYVPGTLIEPGDATATANNIAASESLFRLGQAGYGILILTDLAIAVLLYCLMRPVDRAMSLLAMSARLGTAFVHSGILLVNLSVLLLLGNPDYLAPFQGGQLDALVLLFLNLNQNGGLVWGTFFGLHCTLVGLLVYRSGYLPRTLGVLMVILGTAYLLNSFGTILVPDLAGLFTAIVGIGSIGEPVFALWLLVKGVNVHEWHRRRDG